METVIHGLYVDDCTSIGVDGAPKCNGGNFGH